ERESTLKKPSFVRANVTPRTLRSSSERRLALPSVQVRQSRLFSFVVPRWWNELPSTTRAGASLSTFKKLLKTQLREHLPSNWHLTSQGRRSHFIVGGG